VDLAALEINVLVSQRDGLTGPEAGQAEQVEHDLLPWRRGCCNEMRCRFRG
jgi:hypothetical protein